MTMNHTLRIFQTTNPHPFQLCINYCNEKLQSYFTDHVFKLEQEEYKKENIDVSEITYKDNQGVLELLEKKRSGLFAKIVEEGSVPRGSDDNLLKKMLKEYKDNANFKPPTRKGNQREFTVVHFAGDVAYLIDGFLAKNKDKVPLDLLTIAENSSQAFTAILFPKEVIDNGKKTKKGRAASSLGAVMGGKRSIIMQFKFQLQDLMKKIEKTQPHFVRCIKPNSKLVGNLFEEYLVLGQLRCAGLLDVCRIRQQGYPVRMTHAEFAFKYTLLLSTEIKQAVENTKDLKDGLIVCKHLGGGEAVVGDTKVFLKSHAADNLTRAREVVVARALVQVQAVARSFLARLRVASFKKMLKAILDALAKKDIELLKKLLASVGDLPGEGKHLKEVKEARKAMQKLAEEARIEKFVQEALSTNEIAGLEAAIAASVEAKYEAPSLHKARKQLETLKEQIVVMEKLTQALKTRDEATLNAAIEAAQALEGDLTSSGRLVLVQALAVRERMLAEAKAIAALAKTLESKNNATIKIALDVMMELGLATHATTLEAQEFLKVEASRNLARESEIADLKGLSTRAVGERNRELLESVMVKITELGLDNDAHFKPAFQLQKDLAARQAIVLKMRASAKALGLKAQKSSGVCFEDIAELTGLIKEAEISGLFPAIVTTIGGGQVNRRRSMMPTNGGNVMSGGAAVRRLSRLPSMMAASPSSPMSMGMPSLGVPASPRGLKKMPSFNVKGTSAAPRSTIVEEGKARQDEDLARARVAQKRAMHQIKIQEDMVAIMQDPEKSKDLNALRHIFSEANGINLTSVDVAIAVKDRILSLEDAQDDPDERQRLEEEEVIRRQEEMLDLEEDEIEETQRQQMREAESEDYNFMNYFRIRSDADWAKGVIVVDKSISIDNKLKWQRTPIHKSLTTMDLLDSRQIVKMHTSILGYCGDKLMQFPAALAQNVVKKVLANPEYRNEMFLLLMKHITDNPSKKSASRAWQLLCISVGYFPPSTDFELFLLNFIQRHLRADDPIGPYATFVLSRLQSTFIHGPLGDYVSLEEILAYTIRPPLIVSIELVDGTEIAADFPVAPHMDADDVSQMCNDFLAMTDKRRNLFGLFVQDKNVDQGLRDAIRQRDEHDVDMLAFMPPPPSFPEDDFGAPPSFEETMGMPPPPDFDMDLLPPPPPTPDLPEDEEAQEDPEGTWPLADSFFLGDIPSSTLKKSVFVYKRKLFLPKESKKASNDPVYNRLMYLQALDEVITGNWIITKRAHVVDLVATSMAIDLGIDMPNSTGGLVFDGMIEYFPRPWREKLKPKQWANLILPKRDKVVVTPPDDLQLLYLELVQKSRTYGVHMFGARKEIDGEDLFLGVSNVGINLYDQKRVLITGVAYKQIKAVTSTSRSLVLTLSKGEVVYYMPKGKEIEEMLQEYVAVLK